MRAPQDFARPAPDRRPLDGGRFGWLLPAALVRARRQLLHPVLAVRRLAAVATTSRRRSSSCCRARSCGCADRPPPAGRRCCSGAARNPIRCSAALLIAAGAAGLAYFLLQGFGIGLRGFQWQWLTALFGELDTGSSAWAGARCSSAARSCSCSPSASPRAARSAATSSSSARSASSSPSSALFIFMPILQMFASALVTQEGDYSLGVFLAQAVQRPALGARLPVGRPALRRRLELALPRSRWSASLTTAARPRLRADGRRAPASATARCCAR